MHMLETVLGTKTKVRILATIFRSPGPMTRSEIEKSCKGSMHGTYEQIEGLIGVGILKEFDAKVVIDTAFPYLDDIQNLILSGKGFLGELKDVLTRIDILLGDKYYLGGYWAARQFVVPIDYDTSSIYIKVLELDSRILLRLKAVASISGFKIIAEGIESMPLDVTREDSFGAVIWLASPERGLLEMFENRDCSAYGAHLVLLQNLIDENVNIDRLIELASAVGKLEVMAATLYTFNKLSSRMLTNLSKELASLGKSFQNCANIKEIRSAINTVFG